MLTHSCFAPVWNWPKYSVNHKSTESSAHRLLWMVIIFTEKLYHGVPQLLTKFSSHVHACTHARKPLEGSEACLQVSSTLWVKLSSTDRWKDIKTCGTLRYMDTWLYMLWNPQNQSVLNVQKHGNNLSKTLIFWKFHNQIHHLVMWLVNGQWVRGMSKVLENIRVYSNIFQDLWFSFL